MPVIAKLRRSGRQRPRRPRRLRTVSTLPTLLTLGNLLCGFTAIHFCMRALSGADQTIPRAAVFNALQERMLPSFLSIAAFLIFLSLLFDALDGSVARLTKRTSDFGGQLDSLADVVSFGLAPAMMVVAILLLQRDTVTVAGPLSVSMIGRAMWMMVAVYLSCAALRLARYNVEHTRRDTAYHYFSGLPSPGAALTLASLILLHEHMDGLVRTILSRGLPFVALALGLLMVSRVRYLHLANTYLRGRRPFEHVVALIIGLGLLILYKEIALAAAVCCYAASGPVQALWRRVRRNSPTEHAVEPTDQASPAPASGAHRNQRSA